MLDVVSAARMKTGLRLHPARQPCRTCLHFESSQPGKCSYGYCYFIRDHVCPSWTGCPQWKVRSATGIKDPFSHENRIVDSGTTGA